MTEIPNHVMFSEMEHITVSIFNQKWNTFALPGKCTQNFAIEYITAYIYFKMEHIAVNSVETHHHECI